MKGRVLITVFLLLAVVLLAGCGAQTDTAAAVMREARRMNQSRDLPGSTPESAMPPSPRSMIRSLKRERSMRAKGTSTSAASQGSRPLSAIESDPVSQNIMP